MTLKQINEQLQKAEPLVEMRIDQFLTVLQNPERVRKYAEAIKTKQYKLVGEPKIFDASSKVMSRTAVEIALERANIYPAKNANIMTMLSYYAPALPSSSY